MMRRPYRDLAVALFDAAAFHVFKQCAASLVSVISHHHFHPFLVLRHYSSPDIKKVRMFMRM